MSGVGEAASILTLIKAAAILGKALRDILRALRNAPKELHELEVQLRTLESELERIQYTVDQGHHAVVSASIRQEIECALIDARVSISDIENVCVKAEGNARFAAKFRWATKDHQRVNVALAQVRIVRKRLGHLLQNLSLRASSLVLDRVENIEATLSILAKEDKRNSRSSESLSGRLQVQRSQRRLQSEPWSLHSRWAQLGIDSTFIATTQNNFRDYLWAMKIHIPLSRIVGPFMLVMSVSVRTFPLCPGQFKFLPGSSLAMARNVSNDHPFVLACDEGDLLTVRTMLQNGQGRTSDVVEANWTPLSYAIRGGSVEVVKELLDSGADIDGPMGHFQNTPLQAALLHKHLDLVRFLLNQGAKQDHINRLGWDTMFFCWPQLVHGEQCMVDFLNLLAEDSYQDLDVADTEGWTVLHRVAAYGYPSEVIQLIQLGADPDKVALPLCWNAIHHAVFYGNYATFNTLIPFYGTNAVSMTDERGWTLLHIGASAGHDEIVRHLLRLGADPLTKSKPFMSHMPESLFKRACTPQEVAAAQSAEREMQYLDALDDFEVAIEFWEAQEFL